MAKHWNGERLETFVYNEATMEHLHRYALAMPLVRGKTVLDIACGEGYGAGFLARQAKGVTGIDMDAATIKQASAKYRKQNLLFKTGSVTAIPEAQNTFDIVVSFETLEHVADHEALLREVKRVLKPDGLLLISTPDKKTYTDESGYKNPHHAKELYEEDFKSLLRQHFQNPMFLRQVFLQGSLIVPEEPTTNFEMHTGDYETLSFNAQPPAGYWIALASDGDLPPLPASFFYNGQISKMILDDVKADVKKTLPYRIGNVFIRPLKIIRSLLNP